jgi:hypothetical protein
MGCSAWCLWFASGGGKRLCAYASPLSSVRVRVRGPTWGPERLKLWCARRNGPVSAPAVPVFWGVPSTNSRFCASSCTAFGTLVFPAHASRNHSAAHTQTWRLPVSVTDPCSALGLASAPLPRVVPLTAASVLPLWAVHGPPERSASGGLPVIAQRLRTRRRRIHGRPSYWPWRSSSSLLARTVSPACVLVHHLCANVPPVR